MKIGDKIKVTLDWTDYHKYMVAPYNNLYAIQTIEGTVARSSSIDDVNSFRIETGNRLHPYAVIPQDRVIKIELNGEITPINFKKQDDSEKSWTVVGSKNNNYIVKKSGRNWSCTCSGFAFRRTCKHVKEKQEELNG